MSRSGTSVATLRVLDSTFELGTGADAARRETDAAVAELDRLLAAFAAPPGSAAPPGLGTPASAAVVHRLRVETGPGRPDPVPAVLARINATALQEYAGLAVHAGVLSRRGTTVAVPGRSGRGKSTLVAAGVRAGFDYVSDEALCLPWPGRDADPLPAVTAYPRPIGLSRWSAGQLGISAGTPESVPETYVTAADLGGRICRQPPPVRHVVLLGCAAPETELVPARRSEAAAALLRLSFTAWRRPDAAFALAHRLAARAQVWRLRPGPPAEAAARLVSLSDGGSDETGR